jgi:hypothetical protein
LRQYLKGKAQGRILSEEVLWEEAPALWLVFDVPTPLDFYWALGAVLDTLKQALEESQNREELQRYVIEFQWPYTFIIPLVQGKSLGKIAWRFLTTSFWWGSTSEASNPWNYVPIPIPEDVWEALGLSVWEHQRLKIVNQLQEAVVSLSLLVARVCDLERMPEANETGQKLLQDFVTEQGPLISAACQRALDTMTEMMGEFNTLTTKEQEERPALVSAMQSLSELAGSILPERGAKNETRLTLTVAQDWLQRLETARSQVEAVRLYWIADILGEKPRSSP